jgi:hypothetical protein
MKFTTLSNQYTGISYVVEWTFVTIYRLINPVAIKLYYNTDRTESMLPLVRQVSDGV